MNICINRQRLLLRICLKLKDIMPNFQGHSMANGSIAMAMATIAVAAMAVCVSAADPDPLQDFCIADLTSWTRVNGYPCRDPAKATNEDFVYRGLRKSSDTANPLGTVVTPAFVGQWPALNTQGISWARIDYAPNGLHNLHWHPRASEILYCQEGTLLAGFVDATENKFWYNTMQAGDLALFPRGNLHFEMNIDGYENAVAHLVHNSQNAGMQAEGDSTFGSHPSIPDNILRRAFDLDEKTVQHLKQFFSGPQLASLMNTSMFGEVHIST